MSTDHEHGPACTLGNTPGQPCDDCVRACRITKRNPAPPPKRTMSEASIRRRIKSRLTTISSNAIEAAAHDDPASDDVADWLTAIEDLLAIVRDRIGDLLYARAQQAGCSCSPDSGAIENGTHEPGCDIYARTDAPRCNAPLGEVDAPDAIRCTAAAGHIGEHRNGDRTWA